MRITSIGEILYDVYPDKKRLGGAPFNFIYHIWKLTGEGNFISSVGDDENGKEIIGRLKSIGFNIENIFIDKKNPTGTVNVKILEDKTPRFTISPECSYDFIRLNERINDLIDNRTDMLYFGTLSQRNETTRETIQSLFNKNIKRISDLNLRHDFFSKEMVERSMIASDVIKINLDELDKLKSFFFLSEELESALKELLVKFDIDLICVTLGENGAVLFDGKEFNRCRTKPLKLADTVGAGDAFAAALCIGYCKKWKIEAINKFANEFAADICGVEGAVPEDDEIYDKYKVTIEDDG